MGLQGSFEISRAKHRRGRGCVHLRVVRRFSEGLLRQGDSQPSCGTVSPAMKLCGADLEETLERHVPLNA